MPNIAVLATLDTKGREASFLRETIESLDAEALLIDIGLVGEPQTDADIPREVIIATGGGDLRKLLAHPSRQEASPIIIAGTSRLLRELVADGEVDGVVAIGGTQGTSNACAIMRELPYGFPKVMVSTVAAGDTSAFVGIKDIAMMFSVSDILGLNPLTRAILANAAGAVVGMATTATAIEARASNQPVIGITNLGVLTEGTLKAVQRFEKAGYETIVFHAVGSGGRAMEQMMKDGIIGAVFDYAMGEISDDVFHGLRAGGPERLTVAGSLGLPQVICPGGAEHLGLFTEANVIPDAYRNHRHTFHNPVIFVPRLNDTEITRVAESVGARLQSTRGNAVMLLPLRGTSRYGIEGAELHDPANDRVFFDALRRSAPPGVQVEEVDAAAEDDAFIDRAVDTLIGLIEASS